MSLRSNFPKTSIYSSKIEPIFMLQEFFAILTQLSSIFHLASIYSSKIEPFFPLHGFFAILTQLRLIYIQHLYAAANVPLMCLIWI